MCTKVYPSCINKCIANGAFKIQEIKGHLYKTFPTEKVTFMNDDILSWKCLVKVL